MKVGYPHLVENLGSEGGHLPKVAQLGSAGARFLAKPSRMSKAGGQIQGIVPSNCSAPFEKTFIFYILLCKWAYDIPF